MKLKLSPTAILAIVVLAAFTIFITWRAKKLERSLQDESTAPTLVNQNAPPFALPSLDGRTISLADYRGKKNIIVSFWASWCGPCQLEMPALRQFYEKHHEQSNDFEILAISIDDEAAPAESFASQNKLPFPVLLDPGSKTANTYGVDGIPALFVVDKSGKVVYGHAGFDPAMELGIAQALGIELNKVRIMNSAPGN
jgi:peroxiredoxin